MNVFNDLSLEEKMEDNRKDWLQHTKII